jgi:hypothetical protein
LPTIRRRRNVFRPPHRSRNRAPSSSERAFRHLAARTSTFPRVLLVLVRGKEKSWQLSRLGPQPSLTLLSASHLFDSRSLDFAGFWPLCKSVEIFFACGGREGTVTVPGSHAAAGTGGRVRWSVLGRCRCCPTAWCTIEHSSSRAPTCTLRAVWTLRSTHGSTLGSVARDAVRPAHSPCDAIRVWPSTTSSSRFPLSSRSLVRAVAGWRR